MLLQNLKLTLDAAELDIVIDVLGKQPWYKVNGVIQKLYTQANNQPPEVPSPKPRKSKPAIPAPQ